MYNIIYASRSSRQRREPTSRTRPRGWRMTLVMVMMVMHLQRLPSRSRKWGLANRTEREPRHRRRHRRLNWGKLCLPGRHRRPLSKHRHRHPVRPRHLDWGKHCFRTSWECSDCGKSEIATAMRAMKLRLNQTPPRERPPIFSDGSWSTAASAPVSASSAELAELAVSRLYELQ